MADGGCARPTGRALGQAEDQPTEHAEVEKKEEVMSVRPGQKAPDFVAPAYQDGAFTEVKLSDSLGHWALLCFYPGDFTFV